MYEFRLGVSRFIVNCVPAADGAPIESCTADSEPNWLGIAYHCCGLVITGAAVVVGPLSGWAMFCVVVVAAIVVVVVTSGFAACTAAGLIKLLGLIASDCRAARRAAS